MLFAYIVDTRYVFVESYGPTIWTGGVPIIMPCFVTTEGVVVQGLLIDAVRSTVPERVPTRVNWTVVALKGVTVTALVAGVTDQVTELPVTRDLSREYTSDVHIFPAPERV